LLEYGVNTASSGASVQRLFKFSQIFGLAGRDNLDMPIIGIAHPAMQAEGGGFAMDEPAKADSLNAACDEIVADHET